MSEENNSSAPGVDLNAAARLIEALDAPAPEMADKQKKQPVEQAEEVSAPDADDDAGEPEQETADEASDEVEADRSDEPETAAEEPEEESEEPEELMLTVKIDGKTQQVSAKEAADGYMRQSDYQRKTQEIAQHRKAIEQDRATYIQKASEVDQILPMLVQKMEEFLPEPPDESLLDSDPVAYIKNKTFYDKRVQEMQVAKEAMQQRQAEQQAEEAERFQAYMAEASRQLPELIPEWKDAKRAQAEKAKMREYLSKWWSQDEINQAADPRMLMLAKKAMERDELISNTKKIRPNAPLEKQIVRPAPTATPNANKMTARAKDFRAASNRLTKSGSLQDAADAIKAGFL